MRNRHLSSKELQRFGDTLIIPGLLWLVLHGHHDPLPNKRES
jgi:hypothetical protein